MLEFKELSMKCYDWEPEEQTITRVLTSLDSRIMNILQLQQYWTLNDAIKLSVNVGDQLRKEK